MLFSGQPPPEAEATVLVDAILQTVMALSTSVSSCLAGASHLLKETVQVRCSAGCVHTTALSRHTTEGLRCTMTAETCQSSRASCRKFDGWDGRSRGAASSSSAACCAGRASPRPFTSAQGVATGQHISAAKSRCSCRNVNKGPLIPRTAV